MEFLNQYTPQAAAAAAVLVILFVFWLWLRSRKRRKVSSQQMLADALPKKRGPLYKLFRGIWICIAAICRSILFLLKLIVPNMVLVERVLVLGGLGLGAYSIIRPPLNWWYVGGGIFMLVLAIVAHAYNDEVRREA